MKNKLATIFALVAMTFLSCCSSVNTATLGAGATAGKDYVTNLRPSAAARQHFSQIGNKEPIETLTRANAAQSQSGVRFVADDGILIPPGVTISFSNKGYCLDPKLPAPVADEEYQLVPASALIPSNLQGIYRNLLSRAATGDSTVRSNMQGLVWALRTAGVESSYASRISDTQRRILDSCSARPGEFDSIHNSGLTIAKLVGELWKLADSAVHVDIAGRRWKPSDFSSAGAFNSAINSQLNSLISQGSKLPIQRTGFNYGELEPGIYTDIRGAGHLAFNAKIANTTNKEFIFYPCNYVGQVGSGSVLSAFSFSASSTNTQRQRVTMGPVNQVDVVDQQGSQNCKSVNPNNMVDTNVIDYVEPTGDGRSAGMGIAPTTICKMELIDGKCSVTMTYAGKARLEIYPSVISKANQKTQLGETCLKNATIYHENKHITDILEFKQYAPAFVFPDVWVEKLIKDMEKSQTVSKKQIDSNVLIVKNAYELYVKKSYEIKIIFEKRAMIVEERNMYKDWIVKKRAHSPLTLIEMPVSKRVKIKGKMYLMAWKEACLDSSGDSYSDASLEKLLKERQKVLEIIGKAYLETTGKPDCLFKNGQPISQQN